MGVDRFLAHFKKVVHPLLSETRPSIDFRDVVACVWVRVVRLEGGPGLLPIIPDGCADLMVYDDEPPCVAGPDATTRWTTLREGTVIVGIACGPGRRGRSSVAARASSSTAVPGCRISLLARRRSTNDCSWPRT